MLRKTLLLAAAALVAIPAVADANHKKPITKSFSVTGTVPYPSGGGQCETSPHGRDRHVEKFRAPEAGTITAEVTGFVGDYDIAVMNEAGTVLLAEGDNAAGTSSANPSTGSTVEKVTYRIKQPTTVTVHVCNYAASPNATGKYTFTYAR